MAEFLRHEIESYVDRNLQDPNLGLKQIASSHHVSVRTVQRLFVGSGMRLTGLVRQRRLEAVRRDLAAHRTAHLTIAEGAARWCIHDAQWLAKLSSPSLAWRRRSSANPPWGVQTANLRCRRVLSLAAALLFPKYD